MRAASKEALEPRLRGDDAEPRGDDVQRSDGNACSAFTEPSPAMKADFERVSQVLIQEWSKRAGPDGDKIVKAMH